MKKIGLALYCEGNSDEYFLSILLQRTSRHIIMEGGRADINIPPLIGMMDTKELGLPTRPVLVEKIADPKHILQEAIRKSLEHKTRRHRKINIEALYTRLAQEVRLDYLKQVPAYKTFTGELIQTFKFLDLIH